jgi:hypothetical protein
MQKKKRLPSFFTKQIYWNTNIMNSIQYDFLTNYFCVIKNDVTTGTLHQNIKTNKLMRLNDFRYKS